MSHGRPSGEVGGGERGGGGELARLVLLVAGYGGGVVGGEGVFCLRNWFRSADAAPPPPPRKLQLSNRIINTQMYPRSSI
jgi:hypothetical protein